MEQYTATWERIAVPRRELQNIQHFHVSPASMPRFSEACGHAAPRSGNSSRSSFCQALHELPSADGPVQIQHSLRVRQSDRWNWCHYKRGHPYMQRLDRVVHGRQREPGQIQRTERWVIGH
ncbi:hypothetical protein IEO21_02801 [Rhodonia placenta]|uniref:Uncharacterized protein n=1 Tax=Rhodonia placenta TaxID=104341 RepID=A0A8H7P6Z2_9APHY|nr:hypothetical protein IEO21_02801 [Postia placenta]